MCMYKKHICMHFFYLSGRVLYQQSVNHIASFFFSLFFLFLDQANSMSVQGKSYCLFKLEFFHVPLLLSWRIDGVWDLVLSPFLFWCISI